MNNDLTLQELLERDADKIGELKRARNGNKVDPSWLMIAEFGLYFGWEAAKEVMDNPNFPYEKMVELLKAARTVRAVDRYNFITDIHLAVAAAQGGKDNKAAKELDKILKDLENKWHQTQ